MLSSKLSNSLLIKPISRKEWRKSQCLCVSCNVKKKCMLSFNVTLYLIIKKFMDHLYQKQSSPSDPTMPNYYTLKL